MEEDLEGSLLGDWSTDEEELMMELGEEPETPPPSPPPPIPLRTDERSRSPLAARGAAVEPPEDRRAQCRRWVFTSYQEAPPEWNPEWMSYLLWGNEICPTTQRHHFQGYLETAKKMTWGGILKMPTWDQIHLRSAKGSQESNVLYCSKDGEWMEFGTLMRQGARSDLHALVSGVLSGTETAASVLEQDPFAYHVFGRTLRDAQDLRTTRMSRGDWAPPVIKWLWGATGTGKSRAAWSEAKQLMTDAQIASEAPILDAAIAAPVQPMRCYRHVSSDHGWWDNYDGQEIVIFDDFRGGITYSLLLELTDGYPVSVSRRSRAPCPFMAKYIFFTSSQHPRDVYQSETIRDSIDQLLRRITLVIHFNAPL